MRKTAVVYLRVSTQGQVKGSGLDRQLRYCKIWCAENNVEVLSIVTDVCSAYTGEHIQVPLTSRSKKGKLGKFLHNLERGYVPTPSYIVFEDYDRLSRLPEQDTIEILDRLHTAGVTPICVGLGNYDIDWSEKLSDYELTMTYQ